MPAGICISGFGVPSSSPTLGYIATIVAVFVGTFEHSLDDKGRVVLPTTFTPRPSVVSPVG